MLQKFLCQQPARDSRTGENAQHPNRTEEMKRTRKIPQQETNRNQVEKYAECPRNSVVRIAALTVHIANRHFYNRRPVPGSQRRNKAVQLTIQRNLFENVQPIRFKGRAKIVNVNPA